jgi:hypothetical protein
MWPHVSELFPAQTDCCRASWSTLWLPESPLAAIVGRTVTGQTCRGAYVVLAAHDYRGF